MQSDDHRSDLPDLRSADGNYSVPTSVALLPVSVVALGTPTQPVEQVMSLQSGFNRLVRMVTSVKRPRPSQSLRRYLALRIR
jgi:hypothetical protein